MSCQNEPSPWRLEWNDKLSVCIPEINAEHQHFIQLINELNEAIIGRMDVVEIKKRMQAILDDATAHFTHEEALFKEWRSPDAGQHAKKRAQAVLVLHEIMGRFERNGAKYEWIEAGLKVKQTLIEHLLTGEADRASAIVSNLSANGALLDSRKGLAKKRMH